MRDNFSLFHNRPRTYTTMVDIKRMFKKHPIKSMLAIPVASLLLGCQMLLYYTTIPFVGLYVLMCKL